jgi:hypothetical protein
MEKIEGIVEIVEERMPHFWPPLPEVGILFLPLILEIRH